MAVDLAVEEINAAGGMMGRKVELLKEDSVNPQTASTKAERMIERDKVACIIGEISSASCLTIAQVAQRNKVLYINWRQFGCAARLRLQALHVPRRIAEFDVCKNRRPFIPARRTGQGQEVVFAYGGLCVRP
jgi:ABC-type branched-subunit amino acid transport system substrate-binding protein